MVKLGSLESSEPKDSKLPNFTMFVYSYYYFQDVYALPAWDGFLSTELINRICLNGFLRRLYKYGFTTTLLTFEQLHKNADAVHTV